MILQLSCYLEAEGDDAECEQEIYLDDVDDSMLDDIVIGCTFNVCLDIQLFSTHS